MKNFWKWMKKKRYGGINKTKNKIPIYVFDMVGNKCYPTYKMLIGFMEEYANIIIDVVYNDDYLSLDIDEKYYWLENVINRGKV